ncbi:SoxR reducing system RseC family protein [Paraferrimonas sedimenticola]|uniref:Sigma-E factor regulatory protein RseC n=1 Tax=Paraferrimonas sedimenticola TaxID=375674 RepID=A0AA37RZ41_9GAMM|nr:SoxR reducing system RseC family protein [Paraferrimonas sedimenticola]GLP97192.1 sigma-E factor regulatory protein RseC [Paraferrimonas sedimenticola]
MIEELGKVVLRDGQQLVIEVSRKSACNHCDSSDNCGVSAVSKAFSDERHLIEITCEGEFQQGDLLRLGIPEDKFVKAAAWVYLVPLIGLIGGAVVGQWLQPLGAGDASAIAGAAVGAGLGWWLAKSAAKRLSRKTQPVVLQNLGRQTLVRG